MSAGVAPGSRKQHLWRIDNRCWRILSWTRGTCIHSGSLSSFSLAKFSLKAQKCSGQTKVPLLPLLWEKAISGSAKTSVTSGNPWTLRDSRQPGEGRFAGEMDRQDLACLLVQLGFKIQNDLGALVCCTRKWCKLHFSLLLKLSKQSCKRQPFVLKYKPLLRGSEMKGCRR